jgi:hypothetical protein
MVTHHAVATDQHSSLTDLIDHGKLHGKAKEGPSLRDAQVRHLRRTPGQRESVLIRRHGRGKRGCVEGGRVNFRRRRVRGERARGARRRCGDFGRRLVVDRDSAHTAARRQQRQR